MRWAWLRCLLEVIDSGCNLVHRRAGELIAGECTLKL
jgi:hypothetical protein